LDKNFGEEGKIITHIGDESKSCLAKSLAIQSNGKIVVAGGSDNDDNFALLRYLPDGNRDLSFGADKNGTVVIPGASEGSACGVAIQPDGKIIIAGTAAGDKDIGAFFVSRYDKDGILDKSFGDNGVRITSIGNGYNQAGAMTIQRDAKIILTGRSQNDAGNSAATTVRYLNHFDVVLAPIYYLLQ
jgi:uncharacterized delta-60 repeat protein